MVITYDRRCELIAEHVTLDGKPAIITGSKQRFATVAQLGSALKVEFAWATVARIVANGGAFKS